MNQLAVALPLTLVSALGIGLTVQNYGFETTDLLSAPDTPTEPNAARTPAAATAPRSNADLSRLLLPPGTSPQVPRIDDPARPPAPPPAVRTTPVPAERDDEPVTARRSPANTDSGRRARAARLRAQRDCTPARPVRGLDKPVAVPVNGRLPVPALGGRPGSGRPGESPVPVKKDKSDDKNKIKDKNKNKNKDKDKDKDKKDRTGSATPSVPDQRSGPLPGIGVPAALPGGAAPSNRAQPGSSAGVTPGTVVGPLPSGAAPGSPSGAPSPGGSGLVGAQPAPSPARTPDDATTSPSKPDESGEKAGSRSDRGDDAGPVSTRSDLPVPPHFQALLQSRGKRQQVPGSPSDPAAGRPEAARPGVDAAPGAAPAGAVPVRPGATGQDLPATEGSGTDVAAEGSAEAVCGPGAAGKPPVRARGDKRADKPDGKPVIGPVDRPGVAPKPAPARPKAGRPIDEPSRPAG